MAFAILHNVPEGGRQLRSLVVTKVQLGSTPGIVFIAGDAQLTMGCITVNDIGNLLELHRRLERKCARTERNLKA